MVFWDDKAAYEFLKEFSVHSVRHDLVCSAASKRLEFKVVSDKDIVTKNYKVWESRIKMYQIRHQNGKEIGTLFCRTRRDGKYFLKDGNHRYIALKRNGETQFRIAIDKKNEV